MNPLSLAKKPRLPRLRRATPEALPAFRLTKRDDAIIQAIYDYRAMTTPQIEALLFPPNGGQEHFTKTTRCQYRLKLLYHHGYLARHEQPQKIGEGKKPLIYTLDELGAKFIAERQEVALTKLDWSPNDTIVSSAFLEHWLSTNDLRLAITLAAKNHDWQIITWRDEKSLKSPQMKDYVALVGPQGGEDRAAVVPDGYFRLDTRDDVYNFFLEIDRGTVTGEASVWDRRDWGRKVRAYREYHRSGKYEVRYHTADLRILTITIGERRLANLKSITESAGGGGRFWFTTFAKITAQSVLIEPIWQVAGRNELYPIKTARNDSHHELGLKGL